MSAEDVMPLPADIGTAAEELVGDYESVAKAISGTQVAGFQSESVPGWIGDSADAYTDSIRTLGEHTRNLAESFAPALNAIRDWASAVATAITTTIPDLWAEYDAAQATYESAIADIDAERSRRGGTDDPMTPTEESSRKNTALTTRDDAQAEIVRRYTTAMETLDGEAETAAAAIMSTQSSIIGTASPTSRTEIGAALFNDIPLVDGQAEWEYAQQIAPGAASILKSIPPTPSQVDEFLAKYGDLCDNPFFAQALSELVPPAQLTQFMLSAENYRGQLVNADGNLDTAYDETLNKLQSAIGSVVVLSTGGINADPAMQGVSDAYSAASAGLMTNDGSSVDSLIDTRLDQWKAFGNSRYSVTGQPLGDDVPYMGGGWGDHYGYEYLATMLGNAAESNPNLALGPKFFEGENSIAHDIVAFDHEHGDEIAATGGYGNWGASQNVFGGKRTLCDPVESMLRLMDDPQVIAEGASQVPPVDSFAEEPHLSLRNRARYDAVQQFLTDSTTFAIDPADEATRVPPLTESGPMNMTRYLTSYRGGDYYTGTLDQGAALGSVLTDAANAGQAPAVGTAEYDHWLERSKRSATIAANFIQGYQEGLNISGDSYQGADTFGNTHAALRHAAGDILSSHVNSLSASLEGHELPGGAFRINSPQGESGYEFRLSRNLVDQIRGKGGGGNGLFTDLAFDQPFDVNNTPDNLNDDESLYGGPTALAKLLHASVAGQQIDLTTAAATGDFSSMTAVQDRWAPVMDAITAAPGQAKIETSTVLDATNRQLKSLAASGLGALPLGGGINSLDGFSKWVINQGKSGAINSFLDNVFSTNNVSVAEAGQMSAHQALEVTQQAAIYRAIAASGSYGNPPVDPALFCDAHRGLESFMADGEVIPYDAMTADQQSAFQQYVVGSDGLGSQTAGVFTHSGEALNTARTEREEALKDE